jgi:hypothetical protein
MKSVNEINQMTLAECCEELGAMGEYFLISNLTEAREALIESTRNYQLAEVESISITLDAVDNTWDCVVDGEYRTLSRKKYSCDTIEEAIQLFLDEKRITIITTTDFDINPEKSVAVFS